MGKYLKKYLAIRVKNIVTFTYLVFARKLLNN